MWKQFHSHFFMEYRVFHLWITYSKLFVWSFNISRRWSPPYWSYFYGFSSVRCFILYS